MMPPNDESVRSISKDTGVSEQNIYQWRKKRELTGMQRLEMDKIQIVRVAKISF